MFFSSWLRKPNAKPRTVRRATSTFLPQLEVREGRDVPSTLTGNKPNDLYNVGSWSTDSSSKIGKVAP
jgi:hypothetical protein